MMKLRPLIKANKGFTLIELMIAMSVLAVLLLIATMTLLNLGKMYTKGTNQASIQDTTRNIISDISSQLQLGGTTPALSGMYNTDNTHSIKQQGYFCIGTVRYSYDVGQEVNAGDNPVNHALWRDKLASPSGCAALGGFPASTAGSTGGQELIPDHMRLASISIAPVGSAGLYNINLSLAYGDDDLLCNTLAPNAPHDCDPSWINSSANTSAHRQNLQRTDGQIACVATIGNQFCAVSSLSVSVAQRVASE